MVAEMVVIPVAGEDNMLLNLCGAHGPFFTRNLVVLKDNAARTEGCGRMICATASAMGRATMRRHCGSFFPAGGTTRSGRARADMNHAAINARIRSIDAEFGLDVHRSAD